ncbi:MAG: type I toxin-antitoxin system SymE family toxin [Prevotellaceae bacterium]|jgi:hypothetical protein|nr:type I toxin-antitoxin system SymE family toxin [Prevotellaceae bacterium]
MHSTEKNQSKEKRTTPVPTFKRVVQKQKEESIHLRAETPTVRYLKLQPFYRRLSGLNSSLKIVPELRLCGNWLETAGFLPEEYVSVTVMEGLLVIRSTALIK